MSYINEMENILNSSKYGSAFVVSDFTSYMDYETAKKNIARLEKKGIIRRVIRGVYDKPSYSKILNEYAKPDVDEVAKAIARNYNWKIAPTGNTALNLLGISTQVPAKWEYISSGQYKKYKIENTIIEFYHRNNKELLGMSYKTLLVIQALKEIGKDNVNEKIINKFKSILSKDEKTLILEEGSQTIVWIYEVIKKICKEAC